MMTAPNKWSNGRYGLQLNTEFFMCILLAINFNESE